MVKISKQLAENEQVRQEKPSFPGLSFVERLFICLTVGALFFGLVISWYAQSTEQKLTQTKQGGMAVSQWIKSAYLLKDTSLSLSDKGADPSSCTAEKMLVSKSCVLELIQENSMLKSLQNPFFPESENASLIAVFEGQAGIPKNGSPCGSLSETFAIFTAAGLFKGKPKAWRGTIMLQLSAAAEKTSDNKAKLMAGYCDEGGRYERLEAEIPFFKENKVLQGGS